MSKITILENTEGIEQVLIDNGDGSFTSMSKEVYDKQQAEQSTPKVADK